MAQTVMVVCDECGVPAEETVTFRHQGATTSRQKDLCGEHTGALDHGSRTAQRGRPAAKKTMARKTSPVKRKRRQGS